MIFKNQPVICIVGLGYVGLPLAVLFQEGGFKVNGFDINASRIRQLKKGLDISNEISRKQLAEVKINFSSHPGIIRQSDFIIVAVPTPVDGLKKPDLTPVIKASETVGKNLKKNSVVVFESTVWPGVTEDICLKIIEKTSGLKCGKDWLLGYSPERINPGDKHNLIGNIVKITSGIDKESAEYIDAIYNRVIKAGTFRARNIKTAEATKILENTQRDINIAAVNEFSNIFKIMNINIFDVLKAANTKWNALGFKPGLVGGHCIGVDPYYIIEESKRLGYKPRLLLESRRINEKMAERCSQEIIKMLETVGKAVEGSNILIMGLTFKENVKDTRNSKIAEVIKRLSHFGINIFVYDPLLNFDEIQGEFVVKRERFLKTLDSLKNLDGIFYAVDHLVFKEVDFLKLKSSCHKKAIFFDLKGKFLDSPLVKGFLYKTL